MGSPRAEKQPVEALGPPESAPGAAGGVPAAQGDEAVRGAHRSSGAVAYLRVSSTEQAETGVSIEEQGARASAWAERPRYCSMRPRL